jgi:hypothetical protein
MGDLGVDAVEELLGSLLSETRHPLDLLEIRC